jgi:hypothetical protein
MGDPIRPKLSVKYRGFLDFEYLDRGGRHPIIPISMGLVKHDLKTMRRQTLYLEFLLTQREQRAVLQSEWIRRNVLPHMKHENYVTREQAVVEIAEFLELEKHRIVEMWTWYGAFDMVIMSGLHGPLGSMPTSLPMFTMDLKQWQMQCELPREMVPDQPENQHHAGADAEWNATMYDALERFTTQRRG